MGDRRPTTETARAPTRAREAALQARWAAGEWRGQTLRATTGEAYQVIYQGRAGGGAGPDFRDAVLLRVATGDGAGARATNNTRADRAGGASVDADVAGVDHMDGADTVAADDARVYGDVELHLRLAGWRAHGHARDPRYNGLALHIVLDAGGRATDAAPLATTLANGRRAPLIILHPRQGLPERQPPPSAPLPRWPCAELATRLSGAERRRLLLEAGLARFAQRAADYADQARDALAPPNDRFRHCELPHNPWHTVAVALGQATHARLSNLWPNRRLAPSPQPNEAPGGRAMPARLPTGRSAEPATERVGWSSADHALWLALAEALGYGRDRAALRAWGARLAPTRPSAATSVATPETLALADLASLADLPRVERLRLRGLLAWRDRWWASGPWAPIHRALMGDDAASNTMGGECRVGAGAAIDADAGYGRIGGARDDGASEDSGPAGAAQRLLATLRVGGGAVAPGRAVILAANVALPFAAAWATMAGDEALGVRARAVYLALPGAPTNQITRAMVSQLGLPRAPAGAAAQQGLHHLWGAHCREKRCDGCPCNLG